MYYKTDELTLRNKTLSFKTNNNYYQNNYALLMNNVHDNYRDA